LQVFTSTRWWWNPSNSCATAWNIPSALVFKV
jgi:hypothetical protein